HYATLVSSGDGDDAPARRAQELHVSLSCEKVKIFLERPKRIDRRIHRGIMPGDWGLASGQKERGEER
ncbi:MAG: hypothetical protein WD205_12215, partial [Rhodothermales bacterium]